MNQLPKWLTDCGMSRDRSREVSVESEQIGWTSSSSARDTPLLLRLESPRYRTRGKRNGGAAGEYKQYEQYSRPPSSSSPSAASPLTPLNPLPIPSSSTSPPYCSSSSSSILLDSRPPKPMMDLRPGCYWVFINEINEWVQKPKWHASASETKRQSDADPNTGAQGRLNLVNNQINMPSDLQDLQQNLPDGSIASFIAMLICLARQGNNNAKLAIGAYNRLLEDEVPYLPIRSELKMFHLHGHPLTDLIRTMSAEARLGERLDMDIGLEINPLPIPPISHQNPVRMAGSQPFIDRDNIYGDNPASATQTLASPPPQQPDSYSETTSVITPSLPSKYLSPEESAEVAANTQNGKPIRVVKHESIHQMRNTYRGSQGRISQIKAPYHKTHISHEIPPQAPMAACFICRKQAGNGITECLRRTGEPPRYKK